MRIMKTVLVYGASNVVGGVEKYLLTMQKLLRGSMRFIFLFEECNCIYSGQIKAMGGEVIYYSRTNDFKAYLKSIMKILREHKEDSGLLYMNLSDFTHENVAFLVAAHMYKYHILTHSHAGMLSPINSVIHRLGHAAVDLAGKTAVSGKRIKRLAVSNRAGRYLYGSQSFDILSPGINTDDFRFNEAARMEMRNRLALSELYVIGFVGRLVEIKNPLFAVDILSEIVGDGNYSGTALLIVGDGPMRERIQQYAAEKGVLSKLFFSGEVSDVNNYMQAMDCMIGSSFSEGFPLVFEEAQMSGLPCFCAAGNYPSELKKTDWLRFMPLDDGAAAWADVIKEIIDNYNINYEKRLHDMIDAGIFSEWNVARKLEQALLMDLC